MNTGNQHDFAIFMALALEWVVLSPLVAKWSMFGPFYVELACSPCICMRSGQVL